jgi:tRNA U34 5-methylaminomethyl-2-thiouridine-forming methyltransferase MnmC
MDINLMQPEIFLTEDGSSSLYLNSINESYHSKYGAIEESLHVFINAGLKSTKEKDKINILEIGFGTGLNALLTLLDCVKRKLHICYHSLEPFPLPCSIYSKLNFCEALGEIRAQNLFLLLHKTKWNAEIEINEFFTLKKLKQKLEEIKLTVDFYHLIYFDAFSPGVQNELWTKPIFEKINKTMKQKGVLVTYSAKGSVRRNLTEAGFRVERLPGPKGKREMIRAVKLYESEKKVR